MSNLDYEWLIMAYTELHGLKPDSRGRPYWRGRIDEYCAQNAISPALAASARAIALGIIQSRDHTSKTRLPERGF